MSVKKIYWIFRFEASSAMKSSAAAFLADEAAERNIQYIFWHSFHFSSMMLMDTAYFILTRAPLGGGANSVPLPDFLDSS